MEFSLDQHAEKLEKAIQELELEGQPKELYEPIRYILSLGGKRIRPLLCMLSCELFSGDENQAMLAALSIEVFHNFTLVHDDIMDEAPLRRGQATIHKKWNRDIAILSGDVMFVKAYELISKLNPTHLPEFLKLFNKTAIEVCEGQQMDMNFETASEVAIPEYLKMIELKTSVLLACSLKMGALISNSSEKDANLIYEFGRNLGIAFQIQDDLLDAYGDPSKFGKRVGGDIISNKKTYLLLSAYEAANEAQTNRLNQLSMEKDAQIKVQETKELFESLSIPKITEDAIQSYYDKALTCLREIEISEEAKKPLLIVADQIMQRKH